MNNIVGDVVLAFIVHEDPLLCAQVNWFLNGQFSEGFLIAPNKLVSSDELGSFKDIGIHCDWRLLYRKTPLFYCLLLEKVIDHFLDSVHLLTRHDPSLSHGVTHLFAFAHRVGNSINKAKLGGQVHTGFTHLDDEQRLSLMSDLLFVSGPKVFGHSYLLTLLLELKCHRVGVEVHIINIVGTLIAPVSDDRLAMELFSDTLLPHLRGGCALLKLNDAIEASLSRHKLKYGIHHEGAPDLALEGRGLETLPDHKTLASVLDGVSNIKEARCPANLFEGSITEGCLDDDVDQVLGH
jgi:hypothetical protein